jgi:hypothetical protein
MFSRNPASGSKSNAMTHSAQTGDSTIAGRDRSLDGCSESVLLPETALGVYCNVMSSANYYRSEAQRCRDLAAQSGAGPAMAERWRTIAAEYETLAEAMESAPVRTQMQPSATEPDDKA